MSNLRANIDDGNRVPGEKAQGSTITSTKVSQSTVLVPPLGQFLLSMLLQTAGLVAAVAFGVFAILSVKVAKEANILAKTANDLTYNGTMYANNQADEASKLATAANRLALLTLCLLNDSRISNSSTCARVIDTATSTMSDLAASLFPPGSTASGRPTSQPTSAAHPPGAKSGLSRARIGMIIGVAIGVVVTVVFLGWLLLFRRRCNRSTRNSDSQARGNESTVSQTFRALFMDTRLVTKEE